MMTALGSQPQRPRRRVGTPSRVPALDPAGGTLVLWAQAQPTDKMLDRRPLTHVAADLAQDGQGCGAVNALDHRQVDAAVAEQGVADVEGRLVAGATAPPCLGLQLAAAAVVGEGLQVPLDAVVASATVGLVGIVQSQGQAQ